MYSLSLADGSRTHTTCGSPHVVAESTPPTRTHLLAREGVGETINFIDTRFAPAEEVEEEGSPLVSECIRSPFSLPIFLLRFGKGGARSLLHFPRLERKSVARISLHPQTEGSTSFPRRRSSFLPRGYESEVRAPQRCPPLSLASAKPTSLPNLQRAFCLQRLWRQRNVFPPPFPHSHPESVF